jgi:hypothetical protein
MAALLHKQSDDGAGRACGAESWLVGGALFANTAAKFWSALIDEVADGFPECDGLRVSAPDERPLDSALLHPESSLERAVRDLAGHDPAQALREAIEEACLFGPPGPVHLVASRGGKVLLEQDLPLACLDADVFPCLLVWLLQWAGVPSFLWNNEFVEGTFDAVDPRRERTCSVRFQLRSTHVSEGLFQRELGLGWSVSGGQEGFWRT